LANEARYAWPMRWWLRRHKMTWLAYPWRVQRAINWRQKKRGKRRGKRGPQRPCCRCGYELIGLPSLRCPECGVVNEAGWYEGWNKAGGVARFVAMGLCVWLVFMGAMQSGGVVATGVLLNGNGLVNSPGLGGVPRVLWISGTLGAAGLLLSLAVAVWLYRGRRRVLWGRPREVVVPIELSLVCWLVARLAWAVLYNWMLQA
jgi:hypothetical protein